MQTYDVIKKCTEIPGVSLKSKEYSTQMILDQKDGRGLMELFPLFDGITLAYILIDSETWPAPSLEENGSNPKGPLIINYCISGRCEIMLSDGSFVYVRENELSVTEHFARDEYVYPRRFYTGIEFFIDTDIVKNSAPYIMNDFSIDIAGIPGLYCPEGGTYISAASVSVKGAFEKLWQLYDTSASDGILQMKLLTLSLLGSMMSHSEPPAPQVCTFYTLSQVRIAKEAERIMTSDLRQNHTARELAGHFSVSETSLKNYFKGVFGQNISVYIREFRMKKAAQLLRDTKVSVSEIAAQVGYSNQSKFAAVFRKQFGVSPLEYRRSARLDDVIASKDGMTSENQKLLHSPSRTDE